MDGTFKSMWRELFFARRRFFRAATHGVILSGCSTDMTLSTRPRFGRASRQAPKPRTAPQDWNALERITSSRPAHGLDSKPQRER